MKAIITYSTIWDVIICLHPSMRCFQRVPLSRARDWCIEHGIEIWKEIEV